MHLARNTGHGRKKGAQGRSSPHALAALVSHPPTRNFPWMVFLIHPLPADFASRPVKVISDPRQTDELEHGDLVQAWGHTFAWNDSSLPHRELDRWVSSCVDDSGHSVR
jgi:hypothetical protein